MGFFDKIKEGMTKTREALSSTLGNVFSSNTELDDDFYDDLEETLILADLGVETASEVVERLRTQVKNEGIKTTEDAKHALKYILMDMVDVGNPALHLSTHPSVILVIGVNGVGKTTTIGKIAKQRRHGRYHLPPGEPFCPRPPAAWLSCRWWWSCQRR